MPPLILVVYATKKGSTKEVAAAVAGCLSAHGLATDVRGARDVADLDAYDGASSRKQLENALAKEPALRPFATAVFGGVFDPSQHRFPFNHMPASDARDWDAIRAWANRAAAGFDT